MKVDKDLGITLAIVLMFIWLTAISFGIVDLYAIQGYLVDSLIVVQDSVSDIYDYILGSFETTQVSLSDETKELVEDLRWKHYPSWVQADILDEWWVQQYPYIKFEDGVLYIVDKDVTWFVEMQRKEEK